ncbi:hypothetical protein BDZ89DRAFT_1140346 [Hymenopellis radicata]|nr:hypothetical protein BDZ89DRAFT_1140346 [Hymenopellis radicata]
MQIRTGLIVSGSAALQQLTRTTYPKSDLDCYVGSSTHSAVVNDAVWTLESFGYTERLRHVFSPDLPDDDTMRAFPDMATGGSLVLHMDAYGASNIDRVHHMIGPRGLVIQVIVPRYCVADAVNILTASRLYCLYPRATLVDSVTITRGAAPNERTSRALAKYERRGFPSISVADAQSIQDCRGLTRRVGDGNCWVLKVRDDADTGETTRQIERNTWQLVRDLRDPLLPAFHFHHTTYRGHDALACVTMADNVMLNIALYPEQWSDERIEETISV